MKLSKTISLLLLVFSTGLVSVAQQLKKNVDQYRAIHWNVKDGLSSDVHNVMIKDIKGFLWIGSAEGELCRFDGASFKKWIPNPNKRGAINSGGIQALKEDSLHNIWIGTAMGLSRYDMKADTFTNFVTTIDSFTSNRSVIPFWSTRNYVYCLESGIHIVAYDIYSLKKKTISILTELDKIQRNFPATVYAIVDTALNCLWMLEGKFTQNGLGGILQISLSNGKRQSYAWPCYKNNPNHRHYAEAMRLDSKRNSIWINTGDGLMEFSLHDKKFRQTNGLNEFIKLKDYRDFVGIDIDTGGRIWLATYPKGILIYDPKTESGRQLFSDPDLQEEIGHSNLHIYCDRDGIIWTSYFRHRGVYQLLPFDPFVRRYTVNPKKRDSLSNSFIHTIIPSADGKIWVGTDDGLNILDPATDKFEVLREKDLPGIRGNSIKPLQMDIIRQKAWLNVGDMRQVYETIIYEMDIKTRRCRPIVFRDGSKQLDSIRINSYLTLPYKKGLLVFDAKYGLFEIKNGSLFADLVLPLKKNFSRIVLKENNLLFLRNFDRNGSLPPNFTFENINGKWIKISHPLDSLEWKVMLYNQKDQTHWVGLRYELIHFDKNFRINKIYNLEDRYNGSIINIQIDNGGNLWFINDLQQIVRLDITTGVFTAMSEIDGYQKQYFDWVSPGAIDISGNLYFGGRDLIKGSGGLDRINPERYSSDITSSVYLHSLSINKKPFPLAIGVNFLEDLSLRYNQNNVSIETGIIDYYSMGKGYIRYKLEGAAKNEDWQFTTAYNTIRYEGLPQGSYRLIMQASNSSNEFNSPQKILTFTISPAFWSTWWFRIPVGICLVVLFYGLIRWRLHQKFRRQLDRWENDKQLAELQQQKTKLEMQALRAQMNPHFIFNSLNSINMFILENNRLAASEYLSKFSKLIRLILQNSQEVLIPLGRELEALQLYLELESLRFDNKFEYKITLADDIDTTILKVPPLIIQPYAENSIWHGLMHKKEKGHLEIEVYADNKTLFYKITDDGIGRKKTAELKAGSTSIHKSMGMRITTDRLAMLNQQNKTSITITDLVLPDGSPGGTEVLIKIPEHHD